MGPHLLDALYGLIGSVAYNGVHLAWTIRRNNKTASGTIDLTLRNKLK
jgi:hypothetical protein